MRRALLACLLSVAPATALADSTVVPDPGPVGVLQASPGLHLGVFGGKFGVGLGLDLLGGVVFGDREYNLAPGVVGGPFAQLDLIVGTGLSPTVGLRLGGGALAPTAHLGFVPYGLLLGEVGFEPGVGRRVGGHARALYGGLGVTQRGDGSVAATLGPELPLLPAPVIY